MVGNMLPVKGRATEAVGLFARVKEKEEGDSLLLQLLHRYKMYVESYHE